MEGRRSNDSAADARRSARFRLALRYDPRPSVDDAGEAASLYATLLEHACDAERKGVDLVWISERPFAAGARLPAALPLAAALAARTRRLRIGVGPLALPLYHPIRVGEDVATLDGISGGRIELALGLGADGEVFTRFGVARRGRGERLEEGIFLLRAAFSGEAVAFEGVHHRVSGVSVSPRPVQRPEPPIWLGATADAAVRRAAHVGAGLLATRAESIAVFLEAWRRQRPEHESVRVALECEAGRVLAVGARDELLRTRAAGVFDLVVPAETPAGGWLGSDELDALVAARDLLEAAAG